MIDSATRDRGRAAIDRRAWADAYRWLSRADDQGGLSALDLENLAMAAYLIGRDDDHLAALDRAHHAHVEANQHMAAARCAFWSGLCLLLAGQGARANGWLARAHRLLAQHPGESVERGYLVIPEVEQHLAREDWDLACELSASAADIGERFKDADLVSCARHQQGRALIGSGRVEDGLALLDEVMLDVTTDVLSPIMTGLIYCSVIDTCQEIYAMARTHEWTAALADWCETQPQMVAFSDTCLVHRAEILQMQGAWPEALREARRACERRSRIAKQDAPAAAYYQQAETLRLMGDFAAAEHGYQEASRRGREPQPGLALLQMALGRGAAAHAAIRRVVSSTPEPLKRAKLLPACVEISLAVGDDDHAREACEDLEAITRDFDTGVLRAMAAHARGAVQLAEGDVTRALESLRRAFAAWQENTVPYQAARVRVLTGLACRAAGDEEGARLEWVAAKQVFEDLGATPDVARVEAIAPRSPAQPRKHGLTARELEVLRLVASGATNRAIARELSVSERTVDRHVSNIFTKTGAPTRAAATAYAYENDLV